MFVPFTFVSSVMNLIYLKQLVFLNRSVARKTSYDDFKARVPYKKRDHSVSG